MAKQHRESDAPATPVASEELVRQDAGAVVVTDFSEFEQDAGFAQEHFKKEDLALPFLTIIQANSPELKKQQEDKFIKGASIGMLLNTVTRKVWPGFADPEKGIQESDAGVIATPVKYVESYTQWWPRDSKQGTGFVKDWGSDATILDNTERNEKGLNMLPDGTYIQDAALYYLIIANRDGSDVQWALVSMKSTQRKKARQWNTIRQNLTWTTPQGRTFKPAPFFFNYLLTTKFESNDKGDWYGYNVALNTANGKAIPTVHLPNGRQMYDAAKAFFDVIEQGGAKVDHTQTVDPDPAPAGSEAF